MTEESGRTEALISWTIKLFLKANVRIYHWLHAAKKCQRVVQTTSVAV